MKPDHIHVFVDVPQTAASCDVVSTFKDISAIELFKAFPQLIQSYAGCGILWSRGYFVSTVIKIILRSRKMITDKEHKRHLKQFHKLSDRHILAVETDMSYPDALKVMARTKSDNVQINISIPAGWKTELENPARIYSAGEGESIIFLDLLRIENIRYSIISSDILNSYFGY